MLSLACGAINYDCHRQRTNVYLSLHATGDSFHIKNHLNSIQFLYDLQWCAHDTEIIMRAQHIVVNWIRLTFISFSILFFSNLFVLATHVVCILVTKWIEMLNMFTFPFRRISSSFHSLRVLAGHFKSKYYHRWCVRLSIVKIYNQYTNVWMKENRKLCAVICCAIL